MAVHSKYQPFSFQERMTPFLMLQEQYEKTNEALAAMGEQASQYYQILDPETRAIVDEYNSQLGDAAGKLASEGMKSVNRTTLYNLRRLYNDKVRPINNAAQTLSKMYESQRDLEAKLNASGQQVFSTKMPTVKDILENPSASPRNIGSGALYNQGLQAAKSSSMRQFSETEFGKEIINGYIRQIKEQGYSPEVVARFMQDMNAIPELRQAYDSIREMYGTSEFSNSAGADQFIMQGLFDGLLYSKTTELKEDIIGKENRAFAHQKALAKYNAELELENALAKAAAAKNQDNSSGKRTIVSPRAVNTISQKFYNPKTGSVEVPDDFFGTDGKLRKPELGGGHMEGTTYVMTTMPKDRADFDTLKDVLREHYSDEEIDNMDKRDIISALEGIVDNSLQDAQGNTGYYWNLDIANTKELLSRTGKLPEVDGKKDGKWTYSRGEVDAMKELNGHGSQVIYDPVTNELFIATENGRKMYRLPKSIISDEVLLEGLNHYHNVNPEFGSNVIDAATKEMQDNEALLTKYTKRLQFGDKLTPEEQEEYMEAYEKYMAAMSVKSEADKLWSSIGPTIMSYLKKIQ